MRLLIASCARLFKTKNGNIYTPVAYGYDFYKRYLQVFDEVCVAGFCDTVSDDKVKDMVLVSGDRLSFLELPYPHGEWDYIFKRHTIKKCLKNISKEADAAILRVPETLCFLIMERLIKHRLPWAIEITSDPLNLYKKISCQSKYRLVYKIWYYLKLKKACFFANGTAYVTQYGLQAHYPPNLKRKDHFTSYYTDTNISISSEIRPRKLPEKRSIRLIHVAVSVSGFPKGHKEAIKAFYMLLKNGCDVELTFVGSGELAQPNKDYIKGHKLENRIHFTGKLNTDGVIRELDKADVFYFPSYNEGLPRVVVEAMSRALPVVATDIPAHRELIEPQYLVPVKDSIALYEITSKMISSKETYEQASANNLKKAREYDISIISERRKAFYTKLRNLAKKGQ